MRSALVLRSAPDGFRRRIRTQPASFVERDAEIVGQRRLSRILGIVQPPLAGDIRWTAGLRLDVRGDKRRGAERDEKCGNPGVHNAADYRALAKVVKDGRLPLEIGV